MLEAALVRVPRSPPPRPRRLQFPMRHKGIRSDDDDDSPLLLALLQPLLLDNEGLHLMLRLRLQLDDLRAIKLALLHVDDQLAHVLEPLLDLSLSLRGQCRRVHRLCDGRPACLLQPKQEHLLLHCRHVNGKQRVTSLSLALVPKWLRFVYGAQGFWMSQRSSQCQRFSQRCQRLLGVPTVFSEVPTAFSEMRRSTQGLEGANGFLSDAQGHV